MPFSRKANSGGGGKKKGGGKSTVKKTKSRFATGGTKVTGVVRKKGSNRDF